MIISEELSASLDEPTDCLIMHRVEPSRLQLLALHLTDKLTQLADSNEQVRVQKMLPASNIFIARNHFQLFYRSLNLELVVAILVQVRGTVCARNELLQNSSNGLTA